MNGLGTHVGICSATWTAALMLTLYGDVGGDDDWGRWGIFTVIIAAFLSVALVTHAAASRLCRMIEQQRDDITTDVVLGVSRELEDTGLRRHLR